MWTESEEMQAAASLREEPPLETEAAWPLEPPAAAELPPLDGRDALPAATEVSAPCLSPWDGRWPVPSAISADPEEARRGIELPKFHELALEKARVISGHFPPAESEYRTMRGKALGLAARDIPHFEKVFRIAAGLAGLPNVQEDLDYDALLILTAWHCVRPRVEGYLGSYPKSLLGPLSHTATPVVLNSLSDAQRLVFDRRAPIYLRYLLCEKFGLRTCAEMENADLRHLLRSAGFRLIYPSAVPELAFPGITRGADPAVRPWKLALRQELTDERAADMLIAAALWQIKFGLRLVSFPQGGPHWNIRAFARTDWEDVFLSLGVRIAPSLMRESGLLDWRAVLNRCLQEIGAANLPPELVGKVTAAPQRVRHDNHQAIWGLLDRAARTVLDRVKASEPQLFDPEGGLNYEAARTFRRWARLFDEVSPQILSRFGVSAFTALHRVAPEYFGWGSRHLKPWELEQEHGKWKGSRGRALLRSAYAYALYEAGLGGIERENEQPVWTCNLKLFSDWTALGAGEEVSAYDFLYELASRHGLTPLLNRQITHTAAVSLLAGVNVHEKLPRIEGCWEVCMRAALERHGGRLEVRLALPDLVPLPLRLRKAVLAPLHYGYLQKEIRLVRDLDLRLARETHRRLEDVPGWWEDERILGTPLFGRINHPADPARRVIGVLCHEPWLETSAQRIRFRALHLLISKRATVRPDPEEAGLSSEEIRIVFRLAFEALEHTNVARVSLAAVRRAFERLLAREDARQMLDSLLLHVSTAYETELWGHVRKFIALDVINDLVALTVRSSLLHLMSDV